MRHLILGFLVMPLLAHGVLAQEDPRARSRQDLLEILRRAEPIPEPSPSVLPDRSGQRFEGSLVGRDLERGESSSTSIDLGSVEPPATIEGMSAPDPRYLELAAPRTDANRGVVSSPVPVYDSIQFPFRTVYKLLLRYNVFGIDYYYVCSATTLGDFHLLTAGHCVFNHDPNGDGFTDDAAFMTEAWAWAAQTDRVDPILLEDFPFGLSQPIYVRAPTLWINNQDLNNDWAIVTLDRRVGAHTGWMGREAGVEVSSLNFTGYPVEQPYVPAGNLYQYFAFDSNNVADYTAGRIELDALVYGGHSGGPVWRFESGSRFLQGVLSTSNRAGYAEATLLTNDVLSALNSVMAEDEGVRPPVARPELVEYQFETDAKDLLSNVVAAGQGFQVEYNVFNVGHASSGPIAVDFYLSQNNIISTFDTYIGSASPGALDPFTYFNPTANLTVPQGQPAGTYWLGWIMGGSVAEYNVFDNAVVIDSETLLVSSQGGSADIRVEPLELRFDQDPTPTGDPIYVEIDWMADGSHSHKPSQAVIDTIKSTFANAGYNIVLDVSNAIPHSQLIQIQNSPSASPEVQALMNQHFDHQGDSRYHYSIWGHNYSFNGGPSGSSGVGDLPGRVHLVTLGNFPNQVGTMSHQIGTFIHEFGHNLGQKHGGADHDNFVPNYMSIMNYHYQLEGIGPTLVSKGLANSGAGFDDFAYSHGLAPTLNESNLNEAMGIGLGKAVDWNCNGSIQSGVATDIQAADWCLASGGLRVLSDFDNWSDLKTHIRTRRSPQQVATQASEPCIGWQEHEPVYRRIEALGLQPDITDRRERGSSNLVKRTFTIYNDGASTLNVTSLALSVPAPWVSWAPNAPFSVPPGGNVQVQVTVDVNQASSGESSRQILVHSNDADESPYPGGVDLVIAGQGIGSGIFASGFESGGLSDWSLVIEP